MKGVYFGYMSKIKSITEINFTCFFNFVMRWLQENLKLPLCLTFGAYIILLC